MTVLEQLAPAPFPSQMEISERLLLESLAALRQPACTIEVGTAGGASLEILARHSGVVHSIDSDAGVQDRLAPHFHNVVFHADTSRDVLPGLIDELQDSDTPLGFVLIDGDHTAEAVRGDIEALLRYTPREPLTIVLHDSFNPACRSGIRAAAWDANPHVHAVELDFTPGVLHERPVVHREMWGGFALALLLPVKRSGPLAVTASNDLLYQSAFSRSIHNRSRLGARLVRFFGNQ